MQFRSSDSSHGLLLKRNTTPPPGVKRKTGNYRSDKEGMGQKWRRTRCRDFLTPSFYSGCEAQAVIGDGAIVWSAEEAEVCLNT